MNMVFNANDGEYTCPRCGGAENIRYFDKDEGPKIKRCLTCEDCDCEWSEWRDR